ncbi:hypothetical protein [Anaerotruncus colihominis]|uniref:hypothetical protein n=1 Tax=Anaerotruncus colihominis TaxID=169435 RepID=UPI001896C013|nr:hypothetical protein [Anaerotruncus colihominis]
MRATQSRLWRKFNFQSDANSTYKSCIEKGDDKMYVKKSHIAIGGFIVSSIIIGLLYAAFIRRPLPPHLNSVSAFLPVAESNQNLPDQGPDAYSGVAATGGPNGGISAAVPAELNGRFAANSAEPGLDPAAEPSGPADGPKAAKPESGLGPAVEPSGPADGPKAAKPEPGLGPAAKPSGPADGPKAAKPEPGLGPAAKPSGPADGPKAAKPESGLGPAVPPKPAEGHLEPPSGLVA